MNKVIIATTLVISILTYSFWSFFKEAYGVKIFYSGNALTLLMMSWVISRLDRGFFSSLLLVCCINNLIDELFFDPTKLQINEYIGFIITTIILVYKWTEKIALKSK